MAEAIHDWPEVFGRFLQGGFAADVQDSKAASDAEDGSQLVRRIFTAEPAVYRASVKLRGDLLRMFEAWYTHTLNQGTEWFQVDIQDGKDLVRVDARFVGTYQPKLSGPLHWTVAFSLRVERREILTAEQLAALLAHGPDVLREAGADLAAIIHEQLTGPLAW